MMYMRGYTSRILGIRRQADQSKLRSTWPTALMAYIWPDGSDLFEVQTAASLLIEMGVQKQKRFVGCCWQGSRIPSLFLGYLLAMAAGRKFLTMFEN